MSDYCILIDDDGSGNFAAVAKRTPTTLPVSAVALTLPSALENNNAGLTRKTITGATNAAPIVISSTAHGFAVGDLITVENVGGNTNANGTFIVSVSNANDLTLQGSSGNSAYTSGGTMYSMTKTKRIGRAIDACLTAILNDRAAGN